MDLALQWPQLLLRMPDRDAGAVGIEQCTAGVFQTGAPSFTRRSGLFSSWAASMRAAAIGTDDAIGGIARGGTTAGATGKRSFIISSESPVSTDRAFLQRHALGRKVRSEAVGVLATTREFTKKARPRDFRELKKLETNITTSTSTVLALAERRGVSPCRPMQTASPHSANS